MNRRDQIIPLPRSPVNSDDGLQDGDATSFNSVDLVYLFSVLKMNAKLIVGVTLACLLVMFVYLTRATPTYTAYARVLLDSRQERLTPAEAVVSDLDLSAPVIAGEVVSIQSNVLLGEVVENLDLLNEPALDPRVPKPEAFVSWIKRLARGGEPPHLVAQQLSDDVLRSIVVDSLRQNLRVEQVGVSYAIGMNYRSSDPRLAAMITNAVAEGYIASQLDEKLSASTRANTWLSDRLVELSNQVQSTDAEVVEFRAAMIERAEGSEESISQLLAELNTRLVESATERADAAVRLSQVELLLRDGGLEAASDVVTSPFLQTMQQQNAELTARRAQLGSTLGRMHPEMVRISAQIANINRSMERELNRRIEEMRSEVVVTRNRGEALRGQIRGVSTRADALARDSVRLSQLTRQADATRLVYENFLSRFIETSAQADFQTPEARVIGWAKVPTVPSAPRKTLLMLAALGVGLSASVVWVFLRNLVRSPVMTPDELRALTGRPMLAMLPTVPHLGTGFSWLVREIQGKGGSTFMEHVNSIRLSLFPGGRAKKPKIVMITSSLPNEGKTSLSCALARSIANSGSSVLLLDADLRQPDVNKALKLPTSGACLVDYLERDTKLKDLVQHSEATGIDVIAPMRRTTQAAELLSTSKFEGLLVRMSSHYDVIVVNAPPVLYMLDALQLAEKANFSVFCVHCGRTPARVVRNSIMRLKASGLTVSGTVLTMVRKSHAAASETDLNAYY